MVKPPVWLIRRCIPPGWHRCNKARVYLCLGDYRCEVSAQIHYHLGDYMAYVFAVCLCHLGDCVADGIPRQTIPPRWLYGTMRLREIYTTKVTTLVIYPRELYATKVTIWWEYITVCLCHLGDTIWWRRWGYIRGGLCHLGDYMVEVLPRQTMPPRWLYGDDISWGVYAT